jgi:hypothetical protein
MDYTGVIIMTAVILMAESVNAMSGEVPLNVVSKSKHAEGVCALDKPCLAVDLDKDLSSMKTAKAKDNILPYIFLAGAIGLFILGIIGYIGADKLTDLAGVK